VSAGCPERPAWVPAGVDPARPLSARLYDYLLGGSHHLPADRELAERLLAARPDLAARARSNRAFLRRAVRFLAGRGIRQFLDLGSGLPTAGNVHEIAQAVEPRSRVLYVDIDPVAVAHARALLGNRRRVRVVEGDLRRPREVLGDPAGDGLLDLAEPVAVLLVSVLQFVADTDDPWTVLARLRETVPSGSHLVISHPVLTGRSLPDDVLTETYRLTGTPVALRDVDAVTRFFDGWQLVEPGVVPVPRWRPEPGTVEPDVSFYAGVAVKA
jgi:hypothetical protein